ncbi:MAG: M56 family metallopeptidase [Bacteroidota bacterium]
METLFIYFLKASALLAAYFLAYHFLLRKETFFTTNRWFLIAGMITSVIIPLLFIKKTIMVEKPKVDLSEMVLYANQTNTSIPIQETIAIDWSQMALIGYGIISALLLVKILTHLFSLFKLLHKKEVIKKEQFSLVDLNEHIAPFSFFNYIVYNSSFYTKDELQSILQHEKIHSKEKHSVDVLLAKIFCIVFWFNPFMWLYKKAIVQNLEYIADQKAVEQIQDKKVYQKALLKVVSHQNCLSITSHFYQSLIKKRIVMLNKNQSKQRNAWKYALIIPALVTFVIFFQVKVIAQEKATKEIIRKSNSVDVIQINKNTSDNDIKENKEKLKSDFNVSAKFSKVKRNKKGELTSIKVIVKTPQGKSETYQFSGDEPIKPFSIVVNQNENGVVNVDLNSNSRPRFKTRVFTNNNENSNDEDENEFSFSFSTDDEIADIEAPEAPEAPEALNAMRAPNAPDAPRFPKIAKGMNKSIVIKSRNNEKPTIIIDGEVIDNEEMLENLTQELEGLDELNIESDGDEIRFATGNNNQRVKVITKKEINDITKKAMENARIQMRKVRPEMEKARAEMELSRPEMEQAREEMMKAKIEMEKAREEMLQAKEEMIKAKAKSKTQKAKTKTKTQKV